MRFACWITKDRNKLSVCNTRCFSTATNVARTRLNDTSYINCLSSEVLYGITYIIKFIKKIISDITTILRFTQTHSKSTDNWNYVHAGCKWQSFPLFSDSLCWNFTVLKIGRALARFQMVSLEFFFDLYLYLYILCFSELRSNLS
jgi:hypothetical protein